MNKRVVFILFLGFLIASTGFNVYIQVTASDDDLQAKIQQLQADKQQVLNKKQELKQIMDQQRPAKIQTHHRVLVDLVSMFVETAFVHSEETYQERKKQAQSIMSNELVNTFFPTETYKGQTKSSVDHVQLFIETGHFRSNDATVLVRFQHTLHSLQNDQEQVSKVFLEIYVHKQDGRWKVMDFKEATQEGK
ncbi:hypothetical protein MUO14_03495 [Halobacillus shinanisalinarum]|uniref:MerR family transcriptional regulator n=1 Tax=Halobacillus shinanisalinarum TaxID=2932258 RepID=A0ABY4H0S1_9BACI|nr:hypothetical protein [Halobacillus shinanisalinarum]UOQ94047.1 hypothetical protein MUO14_03495 [Halobacillus shinanisalinarum]